MRSSLFILTLAAGALAAGCSGQKGPAFRPEVVGADQAVVYIYRPERQWAGRPVSVYIDQEFVGRLDDGEYLARPVAPGERLVRAEGESDAVHRLAMRAGESAYLEIRSSAWDERPAILEPQEDRARQRIARTVTAAAR